MGMLLCLYANNHSLQVYGKPPMLHVVHINQESESLVFCHHIVFMMLYISCNTYNSDPNPVTTKVISGGYWYSKPWPLTFNEDVASLCPLCAPIWSEKANRWEMLLFTVGHLPDLLQLSVQIFLIQTPEVDHHIQNKELGWKRTQKEQIEPRLSLQHYEKIPFINIIYIYIYPSIYIRPYHIYHWFLR